MTRDEFDSGPATVLDAAWPRAFAEAEVTAYYFLLDDFTADQAMGAIKALRGSKYRPSAGEIAAVIQGEQAAVPTWDEAWLLIRAALSARVKRPYDDYDSAKQAAVREAMGKMHPLIGAFIDRQGIVALLRAPTDDPDDGHWEVKRLREAWEAHVEVMAGRELVALATGRGAGDLARLDPLAALPGRPADPPALGPGEPSGDIAAWLGNAP